MTIIDAQVHAYEGNHAHRPWTGTIPGPVEVTGDDMVAAMDQAGVDGAILVSPWALYHDDASYAAEVYVSHSNRFRLVAPVDPLAEGVAETVTAWAKIAGSVGIRLATAADGDYDAKHPGIAGAIAAADEAGLPVCVQCWGRLPFMEELARCYPATQFVLDHLGLRQPMAPPPPKEPFADLPAVLALAQYPNVSVKVTGACTLSHYPFPFQDLWQPVGEVLDAFGVERCMWGTDWTRATALVSYADAVAAFQEHWPLEADEKAALMGENVKRIFTWERFK